MVDWRYADGAKFQPSDDEVTQAARTAGVKRRRRMSAAAAACLVRSS